MERTYINEVQKEIGSTVKVQGFIENLRNSKYMAFIVLKDITGKLQITVEKEDHPELVETIDKLTPDSVITVTGKVMENDYVKMGGIEMIPETIEIESIADALPIVRKEIAATKKKKAVERSSIDQRIDYRWIDLRTDENQLMFKAQSCFVNAMRQFLLERSFIEIHTPKLGAKSAEGGANLFKLEYFHRPAILQQSPQFYKQMMVGVFDRVFETAPVFRAEKHNTKRHLNEYTSLDFEMGYIDGYEDIMAMETGFLQYTMELLSKEYAKELKMLNITLPNVDKIPAVRFDEAKQKVSEKYGRKIRNPYDLETEEEALIGKYYKEECGADFVFITHYPSKKRPFYAMDDPEDATYTLSFDLLFHGLEITTGGQRIHDYNELLAKIEKRGMTTEGMEQYLSAFKHGMPPHGGLGIGLERLTMQLVGEDNVRETTLFPRDLSRLEP